MINPLAIAALTLAQAGALPDAIRGVLESQLPAWAQVMGTPAAPSEGQERIAVERTSNPVVHLYLIERKIQVVLLREDQRSWLTEVIWCGQGAERCEDVWKRTDQQWRSDAETANHTGYAVYRDSLRTAPTSWTENVPSLVLGKKKWDKGLCESGLCVVVSAKDSSVARAAVRADGTVAWWDGGYILGNANEKEMVHAYKTLLEQGRRLLSK